MFLICQIPRYYISSPSYKQLESTIDVLLQFFIDRHALTTKHKIHKIDFFNVDLDELAFANINL